VTITCRPSYLDIVDIRAEDIDVEAGELATAKTAAESGQAYRKVMPMIALCLVPKKSGCNVCRAA